jgi:hypothetical protein
MKSAPAGSRAIDSVALSRSALVSTAVSVRDGREPSTVCLSKAKEYRMIERRNIRVNLMRFPRTQSGKIGYILLWLLGVPIPVLLIFYLLRGCT